jgi:hypothetical protein
VKHLRSVSKTHGCSGVVFDIDGTTIITHDASYTNILVAAHTQVTGVKGMQVSKLVAAG